MRVLVMGGGYAGLLVTRRLERLLDDDVDLVLVDDTGEHLVQHELHRAIRKPAFAEHISIPLPELLETATVRVATVADVDRESRTVTLADGDELSYGVAAICLGGQTPTHGIPGVESHATPLKTLDHAAEIRRGFQQVLEGDGTAVVCGAGLAGVQVAGELAEWARRPGVGDADVVLLEAESTIVPGFSAAFRDAIRTELVARDVEIRTDAAVSAVREGEVVAGDEVIPADLPVWTAGLRGPDALGGERVPVRGDMAADRWTFVAGDAARVVDADGEAVPATAQAAVRAADTVAGNVAAAVAAERGDDEPRFEQWRFDSPGWLVSVGDTAVAKLGPEVVTGPVANLVKGGVGVTYLAQHGTVSRALSVLREEVDPERDLLGYLRQLSGGTPAADDD